ncbi:MAG: hypothetical protein IKC74_01115 [Clostridia bacterium]|nr:hypothetical protein [Clostridia bacterium]
MKKRITAIILAVIMILSTLGTLVISAADESSTTTKTLAVIKEADDARHKSELAKIKKMTAIKTSSTSKYQFFFDEKTLTVAIQNKATGEIMMTDRGTKDEYGSQLRIDYRQLGATNISTYFSYNNCVKYENIQYEYDISGTDTIKVIYTLGELNPVPCLPDTIGYNEMQAILKELRESGLFTDSEINTFYKSYRYASVTLKEPDENGERKPVSDSVNKDDLIEKYGDYGIETEAIYYNVVGQITRKKTNEAMLKAIGYTEERKLQDYAVINFEEATANVARMTIPLVYKITDTGFTAEVDAGEMKYPDVETFAIESLCILPYLNAAEVTIDNSVPNVEKKITDSGYIFIPDGSGALVRFEDVARQSSTNDITFSLYGTDNAFYKLTPKNEEQMTMPVFGMVLNELPYKSGFFAIIESGDAVASITSSHRRLSHSVYASFKLSTQDSRTIPGTSTRAEGKLNMKTDAIFTEKCTVRYIMLSDKEAMNVTSNDVFDTSYIGMAECYRDYLMDNGALEKITSVDEKTKLFVEVLGSMKVEEKIATFPVTVNKPLTTFEQVMIMQQELTSGTAVINGETVKAAKDGVGPINFILTGFANEGLSSKYPTKIKWIRSVGGKDGFNELLADAEAKGYEVSPNFDFVYSTYIFGSDNIKYRKYGSKSLDNRFSMKLTYDPALQMLSYIGGIVISAGAYDYAYEKFADQAIKYDMKNIAVPTLGSDLNSNFDPTEDKDGNLKNFLFRTDSLRLTQQLLGKLSGKEESSTDYKLLTKKGNAFSYKYVDYILDISLDSSRRTNESEAVPFLGIVLHGSKTFAGEALNMDGDADYSFLKTLESGANLYFTLAYDNVENLKLNWKFANYYSVDYALWFEYVVTKYNEYNALMASKQTSYITEHEFINTSEGGSRYNVYRNDETKGALENSRVVRVEYSNGEGFFLNYNADFGVKVEYQGKTYSIPALGYVTYTSK